MMYEQSIQGNLTVLFWFFSIYVHVHQLQHQITAKHNSVFIRSPESEKIFLALINFATNLLVSLVLMSIRRTQYCIRDWNIFIVCVVHAPGKALGSNTHWAALVSVCVKCVCRVVCLFSPLSDRADVYLVKFSPSLKASHASYSRPGEDLSERGLIFKPVNPDVD